MPDLITCLRDPGPVAHGCCHIARPIRNTMSLCARSSCSTKASDADHRSRCRTYVVQLLGMPRIEAQAERIASGEIPAPPEVWHCTGAGNTTCLTNRNNSDWSRPDHRHTPAAPPRCGTGPSAGQQEPVDRGVRPPCPRLHTGHRAPAVRDRIERRHDPGIAAAKLILDRTWPKPKHIPIRSTSVNCPRRAARRICKPSWPRC